MRPWGKKGLRCSNQAITTILAEVPNMSVKPSCPIEDRPKDQPSQSKKLWKYKEIIILYCFK